MEKEDTIKALQERLYTITTIYGKPGFGCDRECSELKNAIRLLQDGPVKAKWVPYYDRWGNLTDSYMCTHCEKAFSVQLDECPICSAIMDDE